jgi:hypothetical protein
MRFKTSTAVLFIWLLVQNAEQHTTPYNGDLLPAIIRTINVLPLTAAVSESVSE